MCVYIHIYIYIYIYIYISSNKCIDPKNQSMYNGNSRMRAGQASIFKEIIGKIFSDITKKGFSLKTESTHCTLDGFSENRTTPT